ncbi:DNA polymerase theta [Pelomyxa schiedti]|nr:DNA polymerase theta [Pelomyxa schiedti]
MPFLKSCILDEADCCAVHRMTLEGICGGYACTLPDLIAFLKCTLLAVHFNPEKLTSLAENALAYLKKNEFLLEEPLGDTDVKRYKPSNLGNATYHSSFTDPEAKLVNSELQRAREGLVLVDELHMCYLVTPLFDLAPPNWNHFYNKVWTGVKLEQKKIALKLGISDAFLISKCGGFVTKDGARDRVACRLYHALALLDLTHEVSLQEVSTRFGMTRATLEGLMQNSAAFAGSMVQFCKHAGFWDLEALLSCYLKRLNFGVKPELIPLTDINGVGRSRARALWEAGYRSVKAISMANAADLQRSVKYLGPYPAASANMIIRSATEVLRQQAEKLRQEAEALLTGFP